MGQAPKSCRFLISKASLNKDTNILWVKTRFNRADLLKDKLRKVFTGVLTI